MGEATAGKIYKAIPEIMGEISAVGKNRRNAQQGFMYRGVDDVMNAINPALVKHRVFIVPEIIEQGREERKTVKGNSLIYSICRVRFRFCAEDGSSIEAVTVGEGMDSGDKATNKAMAVAFKYACFQVFCIPTEEMGDPDAETPEPNSRQAQGDAAADRQMREKAAARRIDDAKINTLRSIIMEKGFKEQSVLEHYKIKSFNEMAFSDWNDAMSLLAQ